jgi:hypothetical protein
VSEFVAWANACKLQPIDVFERFLECLQAPLSSSPQVGRLQAHSKIDGTEWSSPAA